VKRVYHPFWLWEDVGMWSQPSKAGRDEFLSAAVEFTGNAERYGAAMLRVLDEFPIACEHNLTDMAMNRRAWIGHAAVFLVLCCPEWVTREAWGMLTDQQRIDAEAKADEAIKEFELARANTALPAKVATQRVSGDTGRGSASAGVAVQGAIVPGCLPSDPFERRSADIARIFSPEDTRLHGAKEA
jgi:hypothetical protein